MIKKVLLLGSGGLRIGQAGEFDYSGSQAIKALKEEGITVVLANPNIATVQTDSHMADILYLQPLNIEVVTQIIEKEQPDAILLGFGGQTALNLGMALDKAGILKQHHVAVLGTSVASIQQTEDRDLFKQALEKIGIQSPRSFCVTTVEAAVIAAENIGYPIMMRSGFSLGGLGSGKISNQIELIKRAKEAFATAPQILIEEYLLGWKEFEYEIVRDAGGNALTICNMENLDPMGIHTGESIVIAPAQTLSNSEHQHLRNMSLAIANLFTIVGECNIQFAINPINGDYRVIEMNARLSRSSALASKATGYPLAFVAAKLALGYLLHEIKNSVTQETCTFFEPALDYVVVKMPRWDTHKLKAAERTIGTEMKSVGEVMGIGRSFPESLQKVVGMLNIGASCLGDYPHTIQDPKMEIEFPTDRRLFALYQFFLQGGEIEEAYALSKVDRWFLYHIHAIATLEKQIINKPLTDDLLKIAKQNGFSDKLLGKLTDQTEEHIRARRLSANIIPYVKQIDTLAGEFAAQTNYLYLTYHGMEHDIQPSPERPILVLGSGPYSIGSSVEFDWCAVNTSRSLRELGKKSILINSNPETVSTDYDESDRLYFEQLTLERVRDIADFEQPAGIVVSVGGQIANNLALPLAKGGYVLLGTTAQSIDKAEDREKFSALLSDLNIDQPAWQRVSSLEKAKLFAEQIGYPVLIRPSYILSGSAMNVAYDEESLEQYLQEASLVSSDHPVVISKFILDAKELEIDGVADKGKIIIEAITEHIENAGIHSGDATLVIPPQRLYLETIRKTKKITSEIVAALQITGPFNIQFIAKNNFIQVIECNLRAARSFPFVSKVTGYNFIAIATRAMLGKHIPTTYETLELDYVGVKAPQFSYHRLKGANPVANVEMASTGEVACLGENLYEAYLRSWLATEQKLPEKGLLISIADNHKTKLLPYLKQLDDQGWEFYSTSGTHDFLTKNGVGSYFVYKASEHNEPNLQTLIAQRKVDLIINIPTAEGLSNSTDGYAIRRMAVDHHIPLITNLQIAHIMLQCLIDFKGKNSGDRFIMARIHAKTFSSSPDHVGNSLMENTLFARDILSIKDLSAAEIALVMATAKQLKAQHKPKLLQDKIIAHCFFEPSTRTRLSFESATYKLGGNVIGFSNEESLSIRKGETLHDTIRVISDYADLIIIRHPKEGAARLAAEVSEKPIINAGDGANQHPTQALVDIFTIEECQQQMQGLSIALVGDLKFGRTIHSFVQICMQFDIRLFLVAPEALTLPDSLCDMLKKKGVRFSFHQSIEEVLPKVDILYMTRLQQERFNPEDYQQIKQQYILTPEMLTVARPNLKVLHPLPRVNEIDVRVDKTNFAYYFTQAANGVFVRQALLALLLQKEI